MIRFGWMRPLVVMDCGPGLCTLMQRLYVDLYHWSSGKFSSAWYDTLSILVAKGRAKIGAAASASDWPKRIRESQYTDHEDYTRGS